MAFDKNKRRRRIHQRIRKHIKGTPSCPRVNVFRSNKAIYAQAIDDLNGVTLLAVSSQEDGIEQDGTKTDIARRVGKVFGQRALDAGYDSMVFDRAGYLYHGRVKALAEGAREAGLHI